MVQEPTRRTGFSGPTLVRLLARLTDARFSEPRQSSPDQLSQWLGWADAIELSAALKGNPPSALAGTHTPGDAGHSEYARVRETLQQAIAGHDKSAGARQGERRRAAARRDPKAPSAAVDYASYRRRYVALQQSMENAIAALRGRLRAMLASRSPGAARLAVVDAAMEQALAERELSQLARIPALLEVHFRRLREAEQAALADPAAHHGSPAVRGAWLHVFNQDTQRVLLAELELRLQPVEGLVAALRAG